MGAEIQEGLREVLSAGVPMDINDVYGIQESINYVKNIISLKYKEATQDNPILIERHRDIISVVSDALQEYTELCKREQDIAVLSSELCSIEASFAELIGIITPDDVLNSIFDNFCIGK